MQEVAPGLSVPLPVAVLLVGKDQVLRRVLGRLVPPDVELVIRRVPIGARRLKPGVLPRGVVHHQVGDDLEAAVAGGAHELDEVAERAETGIDAIVVDDVVTVVAARRGIEGHEPQAGDAEVGQIVDALGQTVEVAAAVAVAIEEGLDVEAVEDGVLPPEVCGVVDHQGHEADPSKFGRTRSPKKSMNARCSLPTWWT
jgi:hypothetical protein